jgi:hypothetical protein
MPDRVPGGTRPRSDKVTGLSSAAHAARTMPRHR